MPAAVQPFTLAQPTTLVSDRFRVLHTPVRRAVGWALAITLTQILVACVLAGGQSPREAYERLHRWDGGWYASIINNGYLAPAVIRPADYGNVAFFPGYPLLAHGVKATLGLSTPDALLLAAQLACWAFWAYLLLFFERWRLPPRLRALGVVLVASHPGAFFLIASYSESLFLAGVLGFLYWSGSPRRGAGWLTAAHGIVMTATRLVGLPLVVFPLCLVLLGTDRNEAVNERSWTTRCRRALLLGVTSSLGAILFFVYCHARFGVWDAYMRVGHAGWGITPDYLGMFSYRIFHIHWPSRHEKWIDPEFFSRLAVPLAVLFFVVLAVVEWRVARARADSGWRVRLGLYLCALLLLYVPVSAQCTRGMTSMVRYVLCVQVLLALIIVHLLGRLWPLKRRANAWLVRLFTAWCAVCLALQILFTHRYAFGKWVA